MIYFLLTLGFELLPPQKVSSFAKECCKSIERLWRPTPQCHSEPLLRSSSENVNLDFDLHEDIDVQSEKNRVLSGSVDKAILYLRNLRKVLFWQIKKFVHIYLMHRDRLKF